MIFPIVLPFPKELGKGPETNAYLFMEGGRNILIDTGIDSEANRSRIREELQRRGAWGPDAILLTHGHLDHSGLAAYIQRETGSEIFIHEWDRRALEDYSGYTTEWYGDTFELALEGGFDEGSLRDGLAQLLTVARVIARPEKFRTFRELELGSLKAIGLPGHTAGSVGYASGETVFAGDAAIERSTNVRVLRDEFASLQRLKVFRRLYAGHGRPLEPTDVEALETHFLNRLEGVMRAASGGRTLKEIVESLYGGMDLSSPIRRMIPIRQVIAYLRYLEEEGHVVKRGRLWVSYRSSL